MLATSALACGWRAYEGNPVLGNKALGTCFDVNVVTDGPAPYTRTASGTCGTRDEQNGHWLLWYNGRNGAPEYIGMAVHEGLDLESPAVAPDDTKAILSTYVRRFNAKDDECYTNEISNARAEAFMMKNVPRFACPDKDVERTYYFRWWTFRKHLKHNLGHWTVTEFLPKVGWSGKGNTIVCPAGHHLREGRWLRDPVYMEDLARFWLSDPEATHRWTYSSWLFTATRLFADVSGRDALPGELLDDAVAYYRHWEAQAISEVAAKVGRADLAKEFAAKAETVRQSIFSTCWNPDVRYRGHDVSVRWQRGRGLTVAVDGKVVASRETLGRLDVRVPKAVAG